MCRTSLNKTKLESDIGSKGTFNLQKNLTQHPDNSDYVYGSLAAYSSCFKFQILLCKDFPKEQ